MRAIRNLKPANGTSAQSAARWSLTQGILFVAGTLVLVISGGVAGYLLYQRSGLDTAEPDAIAYDQLIDEEYGKLSDTELLDQMRWIEAFGLGTRIKPKYVLERQKAARYLMGSYIALGVAATGLVVAGASVALRVPAKSVVVRA